MAGSEVVLLGPFVGGLNNSLDPSSIRDEELVTLVNYEVTEDGTLVNRPVITVNQWGFDYGTGGNGHTPTQTNGRAVIPIAVGRYMNDGAAILYKYYGGSIYWERLNNAANSLAIGSKKLTGTAQTGDTNVGHRAVQYNNDMYFTNARQPDLVGKTAIGSTAFTKIPTMPLGQTILNHKSRLFIFPGPNTRSAENLNNSKFFYTDAPYTGGAWNQSKNFVNVGYGDGQYISTALIYNGDILIFKENSTWRFSYEANIGQGSLEVINPSVGSYGAYSATVCNGVVYTYYAGAVYEIFNYQWSNISQKIDFDRAPIEAGEGYVDGVNLHTLGHRVILNHWGRTYVYSQRSKTWSEWESETMLGQGVTVPTSVLDNTDRNKELALFSYYKHTNKPASIDNNWKITRLFRVFDTHDPISDVDQNGRPANQQNSENFECRIRTKSFDLGSDAAYKRLMWWGASVLTRTDVQGQATVIVNNAAFTYDQLDGTTYDALDQSTWDNLLDILPTATTEVDATSTVSHGRRFIKFLKGLRFRQVYFTYKASVDGTSDTLPNKLLSLTAVFRGKTKMTKEIS